MPTVDAATAAVTVCLSTKIQHFLSREVEPSYPAPHVADAPPLVEYTCSEDTDVGTLGDEVLAAPLVEVVSPLANTTGMSRTNVTLRVVLPTPHSDDGGSNQSGLPPCTAPALFSAYYDPASHCVAGCCVPDGQCVCSPGFSGPRCEFKLQCAVAPSLHASFTPPSAHACTTRPLLENPAFVQCECISAGIVGVLRYRYMPIFSVPAPALVDTFHDLGRLLSDRSVLTGIILALYAASLLVAAAFDRRTIYTTRLPAWLSRDRPFTLRAHLGYLVRTSSSVLRIFHVVPEHVPHTRIQLVHLLYANLMTIATITAARLWKDQCTPFDSLLAFACALLAKLPIYAGRQLFRCANSVGRRGRAIRHHRRMRRQHMLGAGIEGPLIQFAATDGMQLHERSFDAEALQKPTTSAAAPPSLPTAPTAAKRVAGGPRRTRPLSASLVISRNALAVAADGISIGAFLGGPPGPHARAGGAKGRPVALHGWSAGASKQGSAYQSTSTFVLAEEVGELLCGPRGSVRFTYNARSLPAAGSTALVALCSDKSRERLPTVSPASSQAPDNPLGASERSALLVTIAWGANLAWAVLCVYILLMQERMHAATRLHASSLSTSRWRNALLRGTGLSLLQTILVVDMLRVVLKLLVTPPLLGRLLKPERSAFKVISAAMSRI